MRVSFFSCVLCYTFFYVVGFLRQNIILLWKNGGGVANQLNPSNRLDEQLNGVSGVLTTLNQNPGENIEAGHEGTRNRCTKYLTWKNILCCGVLPGVVIVVCFGIAGVGGWVMSQAPLWVEQQT